MTFGEYAYASLMGTYLMVEWMGPIEYVNFL